MKKSRSKTHSARRAAHLLISSAQEGLMGAGKNIRSFTFPPDQQGSLRELY